MSSSEVKMYQQKKRKMYVASVYLFIWHTPWNAYYVSGSPQHAIKVKDKADSKKGSGIWLEKG